MPRAGTPRTSAGRAFDLGLQFALCVVIGLGLGYYADRWLGTRPAFLLIGLGFGVAAAFRLLLRFARSAPATDGSSDLHPPEGGDEPNP